MTVSFFEVVSTPLVTNNTSMDRYDNYWAVKQGGAVVATITSADNRMRTFLLMAPGTPGTLADQERNYYRTLFGVNADKFTLGDLRVFDVNGIPLPPVIPFPR